MLHKHLGNRHWGPKTQIVATMYSKTRRKAGCQSHLEDTLSGWCSPQNDMGLYLGMAVHNLSSYSYRSLLPTLMIDNDFHSPPSPPLRIRTSSLTEASSSTFVGNVRSQAPQQIEHPHEPDTENYIYSVSCEVCGSSKGSVWFCNVCEITFCEQCWKGQVVHRKVRRGVPHEKTNPEIAAKVHNVLSPPTNDITRDHLYSSDTTTAWFGTTPSHN